MPLNAETEHPDTEQSLPAPEAGQDTLASQAPPAPAEDDDPLGMASHATASQPAAPGSRLLPLLGWALAGVALLLAGWFWYGQRQLQQQMVSQVVQLDTRTRELTQQLQSSQERAEQNRIKLALVEERLADTDAQRARTDAALQSLATSREAALVAELRARIHAAHQQAQMSGQAQPLLQALTEAQQLLTGAPQPGLAPLQRAIDQDLAEMKAATLIDLPQLANSIDGLLQRTDTLPLLSNHRPDMGSTPPGKKPFADPGQSRWLRLWNQLKEGALQLVRVRTVGNADSALISPEQGFFVREQLRLRLLNARAALLAGQTSMAAHDLQAARQMLDKYFDEKAPLVPSTASALGQLEQQLQQGKLPGIDNTLKALTQASHSVPPPAPASAPVATKG
ncbi:MAG: uroporphyrinogen-III C-methyltransferase [Brachymonas sp.]|nr:uroporphyrinogen-III C-methyltransferase [Brachymonas sp.]